MILRPASIVDLPALVALIEDNKELYLTDYETFDFRDLIRGIDSGEILTIDVYGYAVGGVWLSERLDDLYVNAHFIAKPARLREILKRGVLEKVKDYAFEELGVGKIKASSLVSRKSTLRLLARLGFKQVGLLTKETKRKGIKEDVALFELRKGYWKKQRKALGG